MLVLSGFAALVLPYYSILLTTSTFFVQHDISMTKKIKRWNG